MGIKGLGWDLPMAYKFKGIIKEVGQTSVAANRRDIKVVEVPPITILEDHW